MATKKKDAKKVVAKKKATPAPKKSVPKKVESKKPVPKKVAPKKVAPKKMVPEKSKKADTTKKTSTKKVAKAAYRMDVQEGVLAKIRPHILQKPIQVPSDIAKALSKGGVEAKKMQGERLFLVDDNEAADMDSSLIEMQIKSYEWFLTDGLKELLQEISPITDFSGKKMILNILGHTFDPPKYDPGATSCLWGHLSGDPRGR